MSILKATFSGLFYGALWQNRCYFEDTQGSSTPLADLANELKANWVEFIRIQHFRPVTWTNIEVRNGVGPSGAPFNLAIGLEGGQGGSDQLLPELAYLFKLRDTSSGPKHRGRVFIPGFTNAHVTNGRINQAGFAYWNTTIQNLLNFYTSQGSGNRFLLVIKHQEGFDHVTSIELGTWVAHLKSRRVGVGA